MKDRIQTIYRELCHTLEDMNEEQRYHLALMGMNRTLCICSRLIKYDFLQDMGSLIEFMEKNIRDIFDHRQVYNGYGELKELFDRYSEQWEDFQDAEWNESRDAVLTGCSYELISEWYGFLGGICASYKYNTPERAAGNMTLPVRCLEGYLRDCVFYHRGHIADDQMQAVISEHEAVENEVKRIYTDIQVVLNSDQETIYKRVCTYSKWDILL